MPKKARGPNHTILTVYAYILGPKRHQLPVALLYVSFILVDYNDGYFLGGSHVVVGLELKRGWVGVKGAFEFT
jgi:hypothetical protein